ncbi:MAG: thioredoxin, partial [Limnochordia bacterium]|jgi:thioredoxin 1
MAEGKVLEFTSGNFESEVLGSDQPVLVDFWAEWCGPCRQIAPVIDQLAQELAGQMKIGKVNVDSQQDLAARYGVMSIPTLVVFQNGEPTERIVGAMPKDALKARLERFL